MSISKALPKITWIMILILLILILPMNLLIQIQMLHISQMSSSKEMFGQMEQIIDTNAADMEERKRDFKEKCIRSVEMVAYYTAANKEVIGDPEHIKELAEKAGVDELHYFTKEGRIYAGTHPKYYGFTFNSGKQMSFFCPSSRTRACVSVRISHPIQRKADLCSTRLSGLKMEAGLCRSVCIPDIC